MYCYTLCSALHGVHVFSPTIATARAKVMGTPCKQDPEGAVAGFALLQHMFGQVVSRSNGSECCLWLWGKCVVLREGCCRNSKSPLLPCLALVFMRKLALDEESPDFGHGIFLSC